VAGRPKGTSLKITPGRSNVNLTGLRWDINPAFDLFCAVAGTDSHHVAAMLIIKRNIIPGFFGQILFQPDYPINTGVKL